MNIRLAILLIPVIMGFTLLYFFTKGLSQDPRLLPSTLLKQPAPNFIARSLTHPEYQYDQGIFQGHYTLLNVWASWCQSCEKEQAYLINLRQQYPQWQFIGLNEKDVAQQAINWLNFHGNPYTEVLTDPDGKIAIDYGVYGTPETFLIDDKGIIIAKHVGPLDDNGFQQDIAPVVSNAAKIG